MPCRPRAGLAAWSGGAIWCIAVIEVLEGLSMGFAGVAIPALVVDIMSDSGHSNAGLGGVMTTYGAGAALTRHWPASWLSMPVIRRRSSCWAGSHPRACSSGWSAGASRRRLGHAGPKRIPPPTR